MKKIFFLFCLMFGLAAVSFPEGPFHRLDVFWGIRAGHGVLFNEIGYISPAWSADLPLGLEARLRADETFYFFTFSAYSLGASAFWKMPLGADWSLKFRGGFFLCLFPFYSGNSNWIYSAPAVGADCGWTGGDLSLEWKNDFRFYLDGMDIVSGLHFAWRFHPRFCLLSSADLVSAVLYDFSNAEAAGDFRIGMGILL